MNRQTIDVLRRKPTKSYWMLLCLAAVSCLTALNLPAADRAWANDQQTSLKAGVASDVITPEQSMWMAGYAARTKPSDGKVHDLHAKALALEDNRGARLVIVTVDLISIPRPLRDWLEKEVNRRYKLPPQGLLLSASHTHYGPELRAQRVSFWWGLSSEEIRQANKYLEHLQEQLLELVGRAIDNLAPAKLGYTHARAGFAMNRRLKTEGGFRNSPNPDGPVDHDVPVLRVDGPEGKLQAVVFGYACHNTTLNFYRFCGDYAGFAQLYLEQEHPGTTAMFIAGCGADQNPYPRRGSRSLEYCMEHGRALANGVESALAVRATPVRAPIRSVLETVTLEFAEPPTREQLAEQAKSVDKYDRRHAEQLLKELEQTGKICTTYPYLVQVVQFGDDLTMVALAGEVVVDYSLRLKAELAGPPVWVAGYCNDVLGYIPSLRVLREGGYEGGGAMRNTTLPGPFAPSVEKLIVDKVHELVDRVRP